MQSIFRQAYKAETSVDIWSDVLLLHTAFISKYGEQKKICYPGGRTPNWAAPNWNDVIRAEV